jgi:hypothetical protein
VDQQRVSFDELAREVAALRAMVAEHAAQLAELTARGAPAEEPRGRDRAADAEAATAALGDDVVRGALLRSLRQGLGAGAAAVLVASVMRDEAGQPSVVTLRSSSVPTDWHAFRRDLEPVLSTFASLERLRLLWCLRDGEQTTENLRALGAQGRGTFQHHMNQLLNLRWVERRQRNRYKLTLEGRLALALARVLTDLLGPRTIHDRASLPAGPSSA